MAIVPVQTTTTPAHTGSGGSQAASFGSLPSSGDSLIVFAWGQLTSTIASDVTCADNQSNTYVQDSFKVTSGFWSTIFRCNSIGSPSGTFTVTVTNARGSNGKIIVVAEEFSGFNSSQPDAATVGATGFGTTFDPTSITTATGGALVCAVEGNGANVAVTSPSSPWVSLYKETDGATYLQGEGIYQILSSPGPLDPSWTEGGGGARWAASQIAYKPAAVSTFQAAWAMGNNRVLNGGVL